MKPVILMDGDDTLWSTMPLYTRVKRLFALRTARMLPSPEASAEYLDRLDQANLAQMGFSKERFPHSLVQAYTNLCTENGRVPDEVIIDELRRSGEAVFLTAAVNMPDAVAALETLAPITNLILVTKGDRHVQNTRIDESGLRRYFSRIVILADKTVQSLRHLVDDLQIEIAHTWSVGNSIRSDINPALSNGMAAVWIPRKTWLHEEDELLKSDRLFICDNLMAAADAILRETA